MTQRILLFACLFFLQKTGKAAENPYIEHFDFRVQGNIVAIEYRLKPLPTDRKHYYMVRLRANLDGREVVPVSVFGDLGRLDAANELKRAFWDCLKDAPSMDGSLALSLDVELFGEKKLNEDAKEAEARERELRRRQAEEAEAKRKADEEAAKKKVEFGNKFGKPGSGNPGAGGGQGNETPIGEGLTGRRVIRRPVPDCPINISGKVRVKVTVDAEGRVTNAAVTLAGTTISDAPAQACAVETAKKFRFEKSSASSQTGTIDVNFNLK